MNGKCIYLRKKNEYLKVKASKDQALNSQMLPCCLEEPVCPDCC
jgi:hypothetical protein